MREVLDIVLANNCNCGNGESVEPEKHSDYCGYRLISQEFANQKSYIEELEAKVQELEAAQRWIPVTEGLPDQSVPVEIWHKVHKCSISCSLERSFKFPHGTGLVWAEKTLTTWWPEESASHWRQASLPPIDKGKE